MTSASDIWNKYFLFKDEKLFARWNLVLFCKGSKDNFSVLLQNFVKVVLFSLIEIKIS